MSMAAVTCSLFGHRAGTTGSCRCGTPILPKDGERTRIRHVLSCFFLGHNYERMATRNEHHEYACRHCGHPLLFPVATDPYATREAFAKKVRYLCNLFGHRVHTVTRRAGATEYACHCGHSFLRDAEGLARVTHPLVCVVAGHFVRFVEDRNGYAEHVCTNCGHTFCFAAADTRAAAPAPERQAA